MHQAVAAEDRVDGGQVVLADVERVKRVVGPAYLRMSSSISSRTMSAPMY